MRKSGRLDGSSTIYRFHEAPPPTMARDATQAYLNEIGRYPLLTKTQEVILGTQVQAWMNIKDKDENQYTEEERRIARIGRRARDKFIKCNLRLVVNVARKYVPRCNSLDLMDLVQEGNVGLARAVEKFDPTRGYAMSTYAYWWIRQAIQRSMQFSDATIRLPIGIHESVIKITKTTERLTKELGREPTLEEISIELEIAIPEIKTILDAPRASTSLDKQANESDGSSPLIELISDSKHSNTIEDAEQRIAIEDAYAAIESYLDETTQYVIFERMKEPPTPWKEICEITKMTRGRLQLMEKTGLQRCALLLRIKNRFDL
jgi:RNA polymerase primary sigma factor